MDGDAACDTLIESGLRGRGGAAFPAGIKWRTVRQAAATQKYIVCNADEGDSGTFSDRLIMESDPYCLIEGMIIAGIATGATLGYIYVRSEYRTRSRRSKPRSSAPAKPAGSARTCSAPRMRSTCTSRKAPARTCAARKRRCSNRSKASAAWCAPSRRCPRSPVCSASRP
jgi:formate dehydrogenase iron-sulfur subunit